MGYNGSGTFVRSFNWVNDAAASIPITASRMDGDAQSFADGLSNCITRDGQGVPTAAISWGGQGLSNVGGFSAVTGTFSGRISRDTQFYFDISGTTPVVNFASGGGLTYDRTNNLFNTIIGGVVVVSTSASALTTSGSIVSQSATAGRGSVQMQPSGTANTGTTGFYDGSGNRQGYIGNAATSGPLDIGSDTGAGIRIQNGPLLSTGKLMRDANFYLDFSGSNPSVVFDGGDALIYDRTANKLLLSIGSTFVASIDASGNLRILGNVLAAQTSV